MLDTRAEDVEQDRRQFLAKAGRFSVVVPPAMILLLSTTMNSSAIAQSTFVANGNRGAS